MTDSAGNNYIAGLTGLGAFAAGFVFRRRRLRHLRAWGRRGTWAMEPRLRLRAVSAPRGGVFDSAGNFYFADLGQQCGAQGGHHGKDYDRGRQWDVGIFGQRNGDERGVVRADGCGAGPGRRSVHCGQRKQPGARGVGEHRGDLDGCGFGRSAGIQRRWRAGTNALLHAPTGLAYDSLGNLYIADTGNNVVRRLLPTGVISTFAGTGTAGYTGDGAFAGAATLNGPWGVAADDAGNVYIADTGNSVVRVVNSALNIATFAGVSTLSSNSGDGGAATAAGIKLPRGLAVDPAGELYIAASNVVRVVDKTGTISTVAGSGATGAYGGDGPSAPATILGSAVIDVMMDGAGNVYGSSTNDNLIVQVTSRTAPTLSFPDTVVGASSPAQAVMVTNTGNTAMTFSADVTSAGFSQSGSSCTATTVLAVGTSCVVNAVFSPATPGQQTGTITLTDNSLNLATSQQAINLSGNGLALIGTTPQTIAFGPLPNVTYGVAPITLTASATSGLTVTYTVSGTAPVTLTGSTLVIRGAGTVSVTASQGGNATYAAATPVTQSFTVSKATLTYTATSFSLPVGSAIPALTYTYTGLVNGDAASVVTGAPVLTTTATANSPAGTYPVVITQGTLAAANYTFAFVNGTITLLPPDFTFTATPTTLTLQRGYVGLVNLTLTPVNNYSGTAKLSCSPLPANVACVFLPTTLMGSGGTAASVGGLSITTSNGIAANRSMSHGVELAGLMLALLGLCRKKRVARLLVVFGMLGLVGLTGCVTQTTNLAAAGTMQITLTAADATLNVSHSVVVSLTLQ